MTKLALLYKVMLVDHDRLFSAALSTILSRGPFQVQNIASDIGEAGRTIEYGSNPDLIIIAPGQSDDLEELAIGMRDLDELSRARLVLLGMRPDERMMITALRGGARACVGKSMSADALLHALCLVMLGEMVYPASVSKLLAAPSDDGRMQPESEARSAMRGEDGLSRRELQILRCLLAGQSNKLIARQLSITESTVKMHFKNVMRKINAQNRTQAAVWAIQNGIGAGPVN